MPEPPCADERPQERRASEIQGLRSLNRDLVSLLALPATWTGQKPGALVETLIDVLLGMLRLDIAYVRLTPPGEQGIEATCADASPDAAREARKVGAALDRWSGADASREPVTIPNPLGGGDIRMLVAPLGLQKATGFVAIGSHRASFPTETESALFKIALNQAAIGLQEARLLQELERVERLALEAANLGTWDYNPATGQIAWSDRCRELFGLPRDADVDLDAFLVTLHPDDRERTRQAIQRALSPESGGRYEVEPRTVGIGDGRERWLHAEGRAFFDDAGRAVRCIGVVLDITERKRAEAERETLLDSERAARSEAERAARLRDEFVATVSHELRTPLNAIFGWAGMLRRGTLDAAATAQAVEVIERNARALATLIDDLLDVSGMMRGRLSVDLEEVDLARLCENAVAALQPTADAKGVQLAKVLGVRAMPLYADANRLAQVVGNLLSNAIKFTPAGGRVELELRRAGGSVEIAVRDTGGGISPAFLPHVFDRFRQSDASTTRKHGGLGLGLWIVRQIVGLHRGTVRAESPGEGLGATFVVRLPIATTCPRPGPPAPAGDGAISLRGLKVLVVDDEPDARDLIRTMLEEQGAEVTAVDSAAAALDELPRARPDVLLSDIGMPKQDGYQLLRTVRALRPEQGGETPAAAVTAYARPEEQQLALSAGYQGFLSKPVNALDLVRLVASLSASRRAERGCPDRRAD